MMAKIAPLSTEDEPYALRFQIGERTLWSVKRRLRRIGLDLDSVIDGCMPALPHGVDIRDGLDLRSVPEAVARTIGPSYPDLIQLERQRYPRHFIRFDGSFEAYFARFAGKTRSTLKRKRSRWIQDAGDLDIREYHRPEAIDQFHKLAGALSARTYQERLLKSGLPVGENALAEMHRRASTDTLRAYILFYRGEPASYLYLPIDAGCVMYAFLGYAPELAHLSPGTVLQLDVLERLFGEDTFRLFDFTEGDGPHKRLFATDHVDCVDLLLLRRTMQNQLLAMSLRCFDRGIGILSEMAERRDLKPALRRLLRR